MKTRHHIDYETFSEKNLLRAGAEAYAMDDTTRLLMFTMKTVDNKTDKVLKVTHWSEDQGVTEDLLYFLRVLYAQPKDVYHGEKPKSIRFAHNAPFEIAISLFTMPRQFAELIEQENLTVPNALWREADSARQAKEDRLYLYNWLREWRCTQQLGMSLSLPGGLYKQGQILQSEHQKESVEGKALIKLFSVPQKPRKNQPHKYCTYKTHPERWEAFKHYNRVDVDAEESNYKRLRKHAPMTESEQQLWAIDTIMNLTGIPIDTDLVDRAIEVDARVQEILVDRFRKLTGLQNPTSRDQLLRWLKKRGYGQSGLTKKEVKAELADINETLETGTDIDNLDTLQEVTEALELRLITSKNSIAKFKAIRDSLCPDGYLRGALMFYGASRTGRWAGRRFQPQNLPQSVFKGDSISEIIEKHLTAVEGVKSGDLEYLELLYDIEYLPTVLSSIIRCAAFAPTDDTQITVADLSSIESLGVGVCAQSKQMIQDFANGIDPYKRFASVMNKKPYEDVTKEERKEAKPPTLGCGYRLGAGGLVTYAEGYGVKLDIKRSAEIVKLYRQHHKEVVQLWYDLEAAAIRALRNPGVSPKAIPRDQCVNGFKFFCRSKAVLYVQLPSGRFLSYVHPKIRPTGIRWKDPVSGEVKEFDSLEISYMGVDQYTKKWERLETHGGKLTENIVQAWARDVLAVGLTNMFFRTQEDDDIDIRTFHVIFHVHDEIVTLAPRQASIDPNEFLVDCMTDTSSKWLKGVPLKASDFSSLMYLKD